MIGLQHSRAAERHRDPLFLEIFWTRVRAIADEAAKLIMRTSFSTLLSKGGVAPRTAQAALRHSDIKLTMETYTDPKLLDVKGALDALPRLPLSDAPSPQREAAKATGTEGKLPNLVAPAVALAHDISGQIGRAHV